VHNLPFAGQEPSSSSPTGTRWVVDFTYTHSAQTTTDSHYRVPPLPGTSTNWRSPIDYALGSVHMLSAVKTKPTDMPTKFQICFEGSPGYGCADQSPTYTKTGSYEWTTRFSSFYLAEEVPTGERASVRSR
jgi:hypothetical protein